MPPPADPRAPSGRSTVMSDVRNKNNQENIKLQKRISDYDREMLLLVKGLDFEKLDLCEFLKSLKNCDSDKLSQFKDIQDEIRRTQKVGSPVPVTLAKALVKSISSITGAPPMKLPNLLSGKAPSRTSASPTKSFRAENELDHLPDLSHNTKEKTLDFLYKNVQAHNKSTAQSKTKQPRVAWEKNNEVPVANEHVENNKSSDAKAVRPNTIPLVKPSRQESENKIPKSIVQRKRRTGVVTQKLKRTKSRTITFEEEEKRAEDQALPSTENDEQFYTQPNMDNSRDIARSFATSTPNNLPRQESYISHHSQGGNKPERRHAHEKRAKKGGKLLDGGAGLEGSNHLLTKAASVFAMQAKFYAGDDSDVLDLTLGLPARSPGVPPLDIATIREDEEFKSPKVPTPKPITPVRTPKLLRRQSTFYDMVVEMNKDKPIFSRQASAVESAIETTIRSASTRAPASAAARRRGDRRTNPAAQRSMKVKVTLPLLLSMGMGTLSDPRQDRYHGIQFAPNSVYVRNNNASPTQRAHLHQSRTKRVSRHARGYHGGDDDTDESDFSDSNYYDSDDSYDMKLLSHRKKHKRMRRRPLPDRIQYLIEDIQYFTKDKPKKGLKGMSLMAF